jgi:AraC-like DNA-binding protein/mannose-6-phosphate isomerase-like protein (cupin superfamily)
VFCGIAICGKLAPIGGVAVTPTMPAEQDLPFLNRALNVKERREMSGCLQAALEKIGRRVDGLKIPKERSLFQKHPAMHYHFKPEIFLQIDGLTEFVTPGEKCLLRPREVLVMPSGLPHREYIEVDAKGRFRNLVIAFYSKTLSLHFAYEASPGRPDIEVIEFFDAPDLDALVTLSNQLVRSYHMDTPQREVITRGLLNALLGLVLTMVEGSRGALNRDIGKVFQTKWLIRERLGNPQLNVKNIAQKLQCSPDYLSHLFHMQTGEKLVHYIQRMRIQAAIFALETTSLYVSEIAWSSGFQDPAYFARVFRKFTGVSPQTYRERKLEEHRTAELIPKTIYHDREDFSHGSPLPGLAEAVEASRA